MFSVATFRLVFFTLALSCSEISVQDYYFVFCSFNFTFAFFLVKFRIMVYFRHLSASLYGNISNVYQAIHENRPNTQLYCFVFLKVTETYT